MPKKRGTRRRMHSQQVLAKRGPSYAPTARRAGRVTSVEVHCARWMYNFGAPHVLDSSRVGRRRVPWLSHRFAAPPARCGDAVCPRRQARSPCSPRGCGETSPTVQNPQGSTCQRKTRRLAAPTCADPSQVLRRSNTRRWQRGPPATTAFTSSSDVDSALPRTDPRHGTTRSALLWQRPGTLLLLHCVQCACLACPYHHSYST